MQVTLPTVSSLYILWPHLHAQELHLPFQAPLMCALFSKVAFLILSWTGIFFSHGCHFYCLLLILCSEHSISEHLSSPPHETWV